MNPDVAEQGLSPDTTDLRWAWVAAGVAIGVVLLGSLVPIVQSDTPRPDVALLVGSLTFVLMGVLVGYNSPGETIREAAIAGIFLVVLSFLAIGIGFELPLTGSMAGAGLIVGLSLSALGGWVGEVLQGTLVHEGTPGPLEWPWILVGAVLGIMLSVYTVFVLQTVFDLSPVGVLAGFLASFFVTAFFVGYFSPGFTILEPALAALLVIAADMILVVAGFSSPFPLGTVAVAAAVAVVIAFAGGYAGELTHAARMRRVAARAEAAAMAESEIEVDAVPEPVAAASTEPLQDPQPDEEHPPLA